MNTGAIVSILSTFGTPWREDGVRRHRGQAPRCRGQHRHRHPDGLAAGPPTRVPAARRVAASPPPVPRGGPLLRSQRPDALARPVRDHPRREPLHGRRCDPSRRAQLGRVAAALARGVPDAPSRPRARTAPWRRRWSSPTAGCGCPSPVAAGRNPSTTPIGPCSTHWPPSGRSPSPTPTSTPRSSARRTTSP